MTVTALYRYPVKSMLGETLTRAVLDDRGVAGDRAYALLDVDTGKVASAKVPRRWARLLEFSAAFVTEPVPGECAPPVTITFPDATVRRSDDPDIDAALSEALGREVKLITVPPRGSGFEELWPDLDDVPLDDLAPGAVVAATTARHEDTGEVISHFDLAPFAPPGRFHDLCALHVMTESTLARLRELAPDSVFDARRYRPNVVLGDTEPGFVENDWPGTAMTLGTAVELTYAFQTMRCVMTTLGQPGLFDEDRDTLRTIARNNRVRIEKPEVGGVWACAGVYADVTAGGEIAVGDPHRASVGA